MRRSVEYMKKRERKILSFINSQGSVDVQQICSEFSVSPSTARKQLKLMKEKGLIDRVHGGAVRITKNVPSEEDKTADATLKAKKAIGELARTLIFSGDIVAVTGGTTTHEFAKFLTGYDRLAVVTNSVHVVNELIDQPQIEVRMCGGILNHEKGALCGPDVESYFTSINIDKFVFSADAINAENGVSAKDSTISHLERMILSKAKEIILLADSSKFNVKADIDCVAYFNEIDYLVTDSRADPRVLQNISYMGVKTLVAEVD